MKPYLKHPISETLTIAFLLSMVGGFLDAYTYLLRGEVFANAQTGNIVLLGMQLAKGDGTQAIRYFLPIFAFFLGILFSKLIRKKMENSKGIHWRQISILIEIVILTVIGFVPLAVSNHLINILISFVCAIQLNSFQKVRGNSYATTMCTGNLRLGVDYLSAFLFEHDKAAGRISIKYFLIIIFFILGAGIGTITSNMWQEKSVWICTVVLIAIFLCMFIKVEEQDLDDGIQVSD